MSEYDGQAATLVPGRLRGYREWNLHMPADDVVLLASLTATRSMSGTPVVWPWAPMTAVCQREADFKRAEHGVAPDPRCTCGIYAHHDPADLNRARYGKTPMVAGVIEAWGAVEVGPRGFRAEHARIVALHVRELVTVEQDFDAWARGLASVPSEKAQQLRAEIIGMLTRTYRVEHYPSIEAMVSDYPPVDVAALLGTPPEPEPKPDLGIRTVPGTPITATVPSGLGPIQAYLAANGCGNPACPICSP